jgi:ribosome assembly protein YihI (activator of Der GTPase)
MCGTDSGGEMMTLQEILQSLDELSIAEQAALFNTLRLRLETATQLEQNGETFWQMTLRFRERMEREGIEFTDEDFADLRDRSPGREVVL